MDLNAKLNKANEAFSAKEFDIAAKLFGELIIQAKGKADQHIPHLKLQKAISLFNGKKHAEALPAFEDAEKCKDKTVSFEAAAGKARCLQQMERLEEALVAFEEALNMNPTGTQLFWSDYASLCNQAKQYEKTLDATDKGLVHQPKDFAKLHNARVVAFFRLSKPTGALEDVKAVLKQKKPDELLPPERQLFSEVYLLKGQELMNSGDVTEAKAFIKTGFELHQSPQANFLIGIAEMRLNNDVGAIKELENTIILDPTFWRARVTLGMLLMRPNNQDYERAVIEFQEALKIEPETNNPNVQFNLGYALYQLKRPQEAKASLQYVYENDITNWQNHAILGTIYVEEENWEKVVEYLRAAIDNSNGKADFTLHYNLAYALMQLNKFKEAKDMFDAAARLDPSNKDAAQLSKQMQKNIEIEEAEAEKERQAELERIAKWQQAELLKAEAEKARAQAQKEKNKQIRLQKEEAARQEEIRAVQALEEQKEAEKQIKIKKREAAERRRRRLEELRVLAGAPQKYRARRPSLELIPLGNTNKNAHKYADWYNEKIVKKS